MSEYVQCEECKHIWDAGRLPREWVPGTIMLRAYCQDCACQVLIPVSNVCTECESEFQVPNDDLGPNCLQAEKDALIDMELEAVSERARAVVRADRRATLVSIARTPPRRLSIQEEIDAFRRARQA